MTMGAGTFWIAHYQLIQTANITEKWNRKSNSDVVRQFDSIKLFAPCSDNGVCSGTKNLFVIWESTAFGFELVKCAMSFMVLFVTYNALISWIKACPDEKPPTLMLITCIPLLIALMLVLLPPFPYVRPWFVTIITSILAFEFWTIGIGYLIQETKLKRICTLRTTATVLGNASERMDKRPGEYSPYTYYPILAYTVNGEHLERQFDHGQPRPMEVGRRVEICVNPNKPEEFCYLNQKENKALTIGVPFALILGTGALIAAVISLVLK